MYTSKQNLYELLTDSGKANVPKVDKAFEHSLPMIIELLNVEHQVAKHIIWSLGRQDFTGHSSTESAIFSAFHKNLFLFFAVIDLSRRGLCGVANSLLRSIYEGLLIAKYCSVRSNTKVFDKWASGQYVHVTNEIINKITKPNPLELREMLRGLNQVSHATVFSQQVAHKYEDLTEETGHTLSLIQLLLVCCWHLLNRHWITPSTIRYTRMYGDKENFDKSRTKARGLVKRSKSTFTSNAKKFIREYEACWNVKA